jgi:hypothetical protein
MKSHVRENIAKKIIFDQMKFTDKTENGYCVEFSDIILEIIEHESNPLRMSHWVFHDDNSWSALATNPSDGKSERFSGTDINDCIQNALKAF